METMTVHLGANEVGGAFFAYECGSALAGRWVEPRLGSRLAFARRFLVILWHSVSLLLLGRCVPQDEQGGQGRDEVSRSGRLNDGVWWQLLLG